MKYVHNTRKAGKCTVLKHCQWFIDELTSTLNVYQISDNYKLSLVVQSLLQLWVLPHHYCWLVIDWHNAGVMSEQNFVINWGFHVGQVCPTLFDQISTFQPTSHDQSITAHTRREMHACMRPCTHTMMSNSHIWTKLKNKVHTYKSLWIFEKEITTYLHGELTLGHGMHFSSGSSAGTSLTQLTFTILKHFSWSIYRFFASDISEVKMKQTLNVNK